jgi:cardiolipin synthase
MNFILHPSTVTIIVHAIIVVAITVRVIMKRPATGVALAWLLLVAAVPFAGAVIYLLIGERRIGQQRAKRITMLRTDFKKIADAAFREGITEVDWSRHVPAAQGMDRLGRKLGGAPTVHGSRFRMQNDTSEILSAIVSDVDAAKTSLLMEFYIWNEGGAADEVLEAVIRAGQ